MRFTDRAGAGRLLAARLEHLRDEEPVVLGLPRGGVPVARPVAAALGAPLDVVLVRKLGVPRRPEVAYGAVGEGGVRVVRDEVVRAVRATAGECARIEEEAGRELRRQAERFRAGRPRVSLAGRTAVLVDDGIATGSTASAACRVVAAEGAARVVLAVPVAPADTVEVLGADADALVCPATPAAFTSVGEWYDDFAPVSDEEVVALLARAGGPAAS
jgi:putative phosphoribosyl transferase